MVIGKWMLLEKLGEAGWKGLIPFYGEYLIFKHVWNTKMFFITLATSFVAVGGLEIVKQLHANSNGSLETLIAVLVISLIALTFAIATGVMNIMVANKIAKAFGHGLGYTLGLIFLEPIFYIILGAGHDQYVGQTA